MNEKILEQMDWRLRVFDSLSFPTLILKPDRVILTANRIFLQKYGLTMDQVVGKTCHHVFYSGSSHCPDAACPFDKVIGKKEGQTITRRFFTRTMKQLWEDRVFSPILDGNGEVAYVMESVRDITRLKSLEKSLKETKVFLEKLIESSPMAIVAADGYANILLMNHAAEELFGYSAETAVREVSVDRLYPPGIASGIMKMLRSQAFGGLGKLFGSQTTILNSKGEKIPVELTASIIYEDGEEVATMGIYNDLREKLAVEEKLITTLAQLTQSEKMASIGKLAAGVAHEINNPLTGILFYASLMLERLNPDDSNREDLGYVIEDVARCKDIVKNLLAYSRQTNQEKSVFPIKKLVEQSLALIRDQSMFRNIRIMIEIPEEPMLIHADRNQMSQVIINIVLNATAAMDGEGTLAFRASRSERGQRAHLEISDTGCGIAEENLSRIFDPFFTTKARGKGVGLGLSTAYGIVKENKGNIYVKETSPRGTTFLIEVPLFEPENKSEKGTEAKCNER